MTTRQPGNIMAKPSREYIHGLNPCFEVLRADRRKVYRAYLNGQAPDNPRIRKLAGFLEKKGIDIDWVEKGRLFDLAQSKEHQGAVLKTQPYPYVASDELFQADRLLLLDNVEDPHNVGAILRCAEVFGFHKVLLPTKGTPEVYPSVVKVSAGASEHLLIAKDRSANQYAKKAKEEGFVIAALDAKGNTSLKEVFNQAPPRLMLVVGGEARAVGQYILNEAEHLVGIPQFGKVNSLNASVAAGIAMYGLSGSA